MVKCNKHRERGCRGTRTKPLLLLRSIINKCSYHTHVQLKVKDTHDCLHCSLSQPQYLPLSHDIVLQLSSIKLEYFSHMRQREKIVPSFKTWHHWSFLLKTFWKVLEALDLHYIRITSTKRIHLVETWHKLVQTGQKQEQATRDYKRFVFRQVHADIKTRSPPVKAGVTFLIKEV